MMIQEIPRIINNTLLICGVLISYLYCILMIFQYTLCICVPHMFNHFYMSLGGTHQPVREGIYLRCIRWLATKVLSTGIAPELLRARRTSSQCFHMLRSLSTLDITGHH